MPTIRIDDEVFAALQQKARPFIDTPNHVLRRLLDLDATEQKGRSRMKGSKQYIGATPQQAFRAPIIDALRQLGGSGHAEDALKIVFKHMQSHLKPCDYESMKSGEARWRLNARWERKNMLAEGLLKPDSPRGFWELTAKGANYN